MSGQTEALSPYATFYLAVEISALLGGGRAGLFATLASAGAASLWFGAAVDPGLALFVASCALFSLLAGAMRRLWLRADDVRAGLGAALDRLDGDAAVDLDPHLATVPPHLAREAAAQMPKANLVTWPELGHLLHEERPEDFVDSVRAWLGKASQ